jgi:uncharacterized phage protein (TIGR01671 family)
MNAQREIKFRMWSKEVKKFFFDPENVYHCLKLSKIEETSHLYEDMVWQQFTGLKDYEHNDIYEGDIVRYELDGTVYIQTVEWGNNGWEMIDTRLYSTPLITNLPNFEVVGNIFENSELLNNELEKN